MVPGSTSRSLPSRQHEQRSYIQSSAALRFIVGARNLVALLAGHLGKYPDRHNHEYSEKQSGEFRPRVTSQVLGIKRPQSNEKYEYGQTQFDPKRHVIPPAPRVISTAEYRT